MRITLYFINWNDSFYLPFIARHYGKFCQKIVMYDNYSDDDSRNIAAKLGFEVRFFGYRGQLNDQSYLDVKNHCWKEERGKSDYVIVCDADEFLNLKNNPIGSVPVVMGYNMISDCLPEKDILEINTGYADENYSKQIIFNPNQIQEINYVHGCHKNNMTGTIVKSDTILMLHYRCIGGVERMINRHHDYMKRMSAFNIKHNMGHHYWASDEQKQEEWKVMKSKSKILW